MTDLQPVSKLRRRRLLLLTAAAMVLAGATWWSGALARWPRNRAEQSLRAAHLDEAESQVRRAIELDPTSPQSYFLLARIQRKQGEAQDFERSLEKAVSLGLDPQQAENERLLALAQAGSIEPVQTQLDQMLMRGELDGREVLEAYVNGCLAAARLSQAEVLIDSWTRAFPDDAQPYYYRGRLMMFYGHEELAEQQFRAALEREPVHHASSYLLGQIFMQQNRPQQALESFQQCDSMRYNAAARIAEATAHRSLGKIDDARRILREVVELPSEDVRRSYQRVGDRFEGAPAHLELGNLELTAGRPEQALPLLSEAVQANPRDLSARHALGMALRGVGRDEEASRELEAVREARIALREVDGLADRVRNNPDLVEERVRIGELYLTYESSLTGEYWLKTALERDPRNQRAHELLAQLYESRADENPAYRDLARQHRQLAER